VDTEASVPLEPGLIWGEEAALVLGLLRGWVLSGTSWDARGEARHLTSARAEGSQPE